MNTTGPSTNVMKDTNTASTIPNEGEIHTNTSSPSKISANHNLGQNPDPRLQNNAGSNVSRSIANNSLNTPIGSFHTITAQNTSFNSTDKNSPERIGNHANPILPLHQAQLSQTNSHSNLNSQIHPNSHPALHSHSHLQPRSYSSPYYQNHIINSSSSHANGSSNGGTSTTINDRPSAIKLLVPISAAGALIGRGGSTISILQEQSGARIKLSQSNDYYPGTQDRIVLITGNASSVASGARLVAEHLQNIEQGNVNTDGQFGNSSGSNKSSEVANEGSESSIMDSSNLARGTDSSSIPSKNHTGLNVSMSGRTDTTENNATSFQGKAPTVIKLLVPKSAGGLLIGKGGQTNKQLSEESGARVKLAPKEELESSSISTEERIVTVIGPYESCQRALAMILQKMEEQPEFARYQNLTTSYSRSQNVQLSIHPSYDVQPFTTQTFSESGQSFLPKGEMNLNNIGIASSNINALIGMNNMMPSTVYTLRVPDRMVGAILGRSGVVLKDLQAQTGAKVTISKRGEYAPGTHDRIVTIQGPPYGADMAKDLIINKIHNSSQKGNFRL